MLISDPIARTGPFACLPYGGGHFGFQVPLAHIRPFDTNGKKSKNGDQRTRFWATPEGAPAGIVPSYAFPVVVRAVCGPDLVGMIEYDNSLVIFCRRLGRKSPVSRDQITKEHPLWIDGSPSWINLSKCPKAIRWRNVSQCSTRRCPGVCHLAGCKNVSKNFEKSPAVHGVGANQRTIIRHDAKSAGARTFVVSWDLPDPPVSLRNAGKIVSRPFLLSSLPPPSKAFC